MVGGSTGRTSADHDHGYKLLFGYAEMVRDLLVGFVREPWVNELQFDTLQRVSASFVSDDLRDREGDIIWRVRLRGRWLYLYLLIEFQSKVDRFMAVRMLGYVSLLYQDLVRQGPKAWLPDGDDGAHAQPDAGAVRTAGTGATGATANSSHSVHNVQAPLSPQSTHIAQEQAAAASQPTAPAAPGARRSSARLPPVLPIVLYNGRPRWRAATEVADLIEPAPGRLARFAPRLSYLLLDEGAIDETAPLALKNLAAALFRLDKSLQPDTIEAMLGSLMEWLSHPAQDSLRRAFTVYILRVLLPSRAPGVSVPEVANLLELRTMLAETVLDWKKQWLEEGKAEGKAEGMAEGKATGVAEGKAASLERLLTRRFGPPPDWVAARLKGAPVDQLDTWFDRALDAATLTEVFGGH